MEKEKRITEPVQVDVKIKRKVEDLLFKRRKKGDKMPIGKFFEIAAEEKLKSDKTL